MNDIRYTEEMTGEEYNMLRESVNWTLLTTNQAKRGLEHTTFLVAARDGEKAVGMGRVMFDFGYTAYIGDIIVLPEYQGRGIGKCIVEMLMNKVIDASSSDERIMFILGAAKGKEGFYQKMGFMERPNETMGPGMIRWMKVK